MSEEGVWSAQDTTPSDVDDALRGLLAEQHARSSSFTPARVLNLIVVVDHDWRGEVLNRLERIDRYHPSRTIVCCVEPERATIDAVVTTTSDGDPNPDDEEVLTHERVVLELGPAQLEGLDTVVDPLLIPDLTTVCWSPHGHRVDPLVGRAQAFLLDSVGAEEPAAALARACELAEDGYVVDLAWLRSAPWRERVAASFDPPAWRPELARLSAVTVRHHPDSEIAGLLFLGWLATRLGWEPARLERDGDGARGSARAGQAELSLRLELAAHGSVPGLSGVTLESASGMSLSLDRGAGGLHAHRRDADGDESSWTLLGASRGEAGILGEGIRQALLRDPTYAPALAAARVMAP